MSAEPAGAHGLESDGGEGQEKWHGIHAEGESSGLVHCTTGTVDEEKMHNDSIHRMAVLEARYAVKMGRYPCW
ncbi:uncharacterized protein N7496_004944 [Penicillium cataractarum]|uniref:Uncharacterized protein n=1 Tax=Penicillium cataractarum TaxID=2100454 RepID=A0A9W9SGE4_9EURO|nr:uncharacterized protein N7496_004944 [Penicillium cataractarum]KAJ5377535.1 hypothetical protein N7496_004944 [Penicillium cataractarum]